MIARPGRILFLLHTAVAYIVAATLGYAVYQPGNKGLEYYKYNGLIYLIKDDLFFSLMLLLLAIFAALRGIRRAKDTMNSQKASAWLLLDVLLLGILMANLVSAIVFLYREGPGSFSIDAVGALLMIYTLFGTIFGIAIGMPLLIINLIWLKVHTSDRAAQNPASH